MLNPGSPGVASKNRSLVQGTQKGRPFCEIPKLFSAFPILFYCMLKDYTVTAYCGGEAVWSQKVEGNYQRLNILNLPEAVKADRVEIAVHATNGDPDARIFEVRVY